MATSSSIPVKFTKDYQRFEVDPLNRDLRPDPKLAESFRTHGYLPEYPVICSLNGSGKFHVNAGHHRLDLARKLDTGVWYMVVEPKLSLFERESSSHAHWSVEDFITAYAKAGNEQYVNLIAFAHSHNLPASAAATILYGQTSSGNVQGHLKDGTFVIRDLPFAESVVAVSDDLFALGVTFATSRSFVMALSQMVKLDDFDPQRLVHRATLYPANLRKRATAEEYLDEIEAFYNYGNRMDQRVPLAFLAKAAAKQRCPVKR